MVIRLTGSLIRNEHSSKWLQKPGDLTRIHLFSFFLTAPRGSDIQNPNLKARSSGGERYPDTVEVVGSNPTVPTSINRGLRAMQLVSPFLVVLSGQQAV